MAIKSCDEYQIELENLELNEKQLSDLENYLWKKSDICDLIPANQYNGNKMGTYYLSIDIQGRENAERVESDLMKIIENGKKGVTVFVLLKDRIVKQCYAEHIGEHYVQVAGCTYRRHEPGRSYYPDIKSLLQAALDRADTELGRLRGAVDWQEQLIANIKTLQNRNEALDVGIKGLDLQVGKKCSTLGYD